MIFSGVSELVHDSLGNFIPPKEFGAALEGSQERMGRKMMANEVIKL